MELLTRLLQANNEQEVTDALTNTEVYLSNLGESWKPFYSRLESLNSIEPLASLLQELTFQKLSYFNQIKGYPLPSLDLRPEKIREKLFPESSGWQTYRALEEFSDQILVTVDGERFETNLIIRGQAGAPDTNRVASLLMAFCGLNQYCLIVQESKKPQFTLFRRSASGGAESLDSFKINPNSTTDSWIIKLYNYTLPIGGRSVISKDLLDHLQQYLHDTTLPITLRDKSERYSFDRFLTKTTLGLTFKIQKFKAQQIEYCEQVSIGKATINIYLFKKTFPGKHEQTTMNLIKQQYFRYNMHIVFLSGGIVKRYLDQDFLTYKAGLPHLSFFLLISVENTEGKDFNLFKEDLAGYLRGHHRLLALERQYNDELTLG
ncbi:hypothetical protein ACFQZX_00485 [Mucilaginibacter litoreus]|uniref:Uncharacterized protein n=1 Tax=Mucilaginibacter litoreus TaxID=1048221 RepID=A0ABW3AM21_9SPHI